MHFCGLATAAKNRTDKVAYEMSLDPTWQKQIDVKYAHKESRLVCILGNWL